MALACSSVIFILRLLFLCSLQPGQPLVHLHHQNTTFKLDKVFFSWSNQLVSIHEGASNFWAALESQSTHTHTHCFSYDFSCLCYNSLRVWLQGIIAASFSHPCTHDQHSNQGWTLKSQSPFISVPTEDGQKLWEKLFTCYRNCFFFFF